MKLKKILLIWGIISVCLLFCGISVSAEIYSGNCGADGDNVTWSLNTETFRLEIIGKGDMIDYISQEYVPWYPYRLYVEKVTIGDRVTSIGDYAFNNCYSGFFTSIDIPDSVTSIGNRAFYCCTSLTSINVPDSVTNIGYDAFNGCTRLTSINIPNSVTSIGYGAFEDCRSLTSIDIPDSITSIGSDAFENCKSLTSIYIPDSVTSIGDSVFKGCESLTSIDIPDSVTSIAYDAFEDCRSLTSITVDSNNNSYMSEDGILFNKLKDTLLCFPAGKNEILYVIPDGVTDIGTYSFASCSSLRNIIIPDGVTSIGAWAFTNCTNLKRITIPDSMTSIAAIAFRDCDKLTDVYYTGSEADWAAINIDDNNDDLRNATVHYNYSLSAVIASGTCGADGDNLIWMLEDNNTLTIDGVGDMANYTYNSMPWYPYKSTVETIIIGDGVTGIGDYAFYDCGWLTNVTIPGGVTSIGNYSFESCRSLRNIIIPDGVTSIGNGAFLSSGITDITLPDSILSIGWEAFSCCGLTSITIPSGEIGSSAFSGTPLESVILGDKVTGLLGSSIFGGYPNYELHEINIPASVTYISPEAFDGCMALYSISVDSENPVYASYNGVVYNKNMTSIVCIPYNKSYIDFAEGITSIGWFYCDNMTLRSIRIPSTVTSINFEALNEYFELESITVDSNNNTFSSADNVLYNKNKTEILFVPTGIDGDVTILDGVTDIGDKFTGRWKINSLYIPDGVTEIEAYALNSCGELIYVYLPDSITSIGEYAFSGCWSLASIDIPDGVTEIGNCAFFVCTSLTSIDIPGSVTSIGDDAFNDCPSLTDVYYTGSEADWENIVVGTGNDCLTYATIHYNSIPPITEPITVMNKYKDKIGATEMVDSEGNAEIVIEFTDNTITANDIMVFSAGFAGGKLDSMADLEKNINGDIVTFSGKVKNGSKLFIWDKNLCPITEAATLSY